MNSHVDHDHIAKACAHIVSDFLRQAIREIDDSFDGGYSKKHPELIAAYIQAAATKNNGELIALSVRELLQSTESLAYLGARSQDVGLTALTKEQALAALKERWLYLHPQHTEAEYMAAMTEFEKLLGL